MALWYDRMMADQDFHHGEDEVFDAGHGRDATRFGRGGAGRVTGVVWAIGAAEVLLWGGCAVLASVLALMPASALEGKIPAGQPMGVKELQMAAGVWAGLTGVVMVLPGIALLVLGFYVRAGSAGARKASRVILIFQAGVLGLLAALNLVSAAAMGDVTAAVFSVVLLGGMAAVLVWGERTLKRAEPAVTGDQDEFEPWNSHLG